MVLRVGFEENAGLGWNGFFEEAASGGDHANNLESLGAVGVAALDAAVASKMQGCHSAHPYRGRRSW